MNNIFLTIFYRHSKDNEEVITWHSHVIYRTSKEAMERSKETVESWNNEDREGYTYTFEIMEYAPVAKVNEDEGNE